jgi:transcriptional regulator with XRE-family HTH domain
LRVNGWLLDALREPIRRTQPSASRHVGNAQSTPYGENLRRLMAHHGLTLAELVARTGVDVRTIKDLLNGRRDRPQPRTLHRLASGLGVSADEFFRQPAPFSSRDFDRRSNPAVEALVAERPELFVGWEERDFDEAYSQFGAGGALTSQGARQVVERIHQGRSLQAKLALLLESSHARLVRSMIEMLYDDIQVRD